MELKFARAHAPRMEDGLAIQEEVSAAMAAIQEAERCRREAHEIITRDPQRFGALASQPSGWCVVTEGFWKRAFHAPHEQSDLRERLEKGHKVILTLGIIADPKVSVTAENHVAAVKVNENCKLPWEKLAMITARAKIHAASSLIR
jgi:preprotein translocase subunit YajC